MLEKLSYDRIRVALIRRIQWPINRWFARRHPNRFERACIRAAAPLVRQMVPNDRWSLGVHAPYWMQAVSAAPESLRTETPKRIFQFACYRGQFTLELALAALLAARGHQITIGYLPKLGSPIKTPLEDHPSAAAYLASALSKVEAVSKGRVKIVCLSEPDEADPFEPDQDTLLQQARSDSIMRLGVETLEDDNAEHVASIAYYSALGQRAARQAWSFLSNNQSQFDLVLIANGMTFEASWFARTALQLGISLSTFEKFAFRHTRITSHGGSIFTFRDLDRLWRMREELGFEREPFRGRAIERARQILDERRKASTRNWAWKYQFAPDQSDDAALAAVGVSANKPYVLICTNVPFDAGYYQFTTLFPSMRSWLVETVRYLLEETELDVVVRIHPGEALHYAGRERSEDNLAAAGLIGNPRLKVVGPRDHVNTYPLMANCHAGVVFSSTTGIEMAMMGRPVVVGSDVYYANRGFTQDCRTREIYFEKLKDLSSSKISMEDGDIIACTSALFYYIVHFVLQIPYLYDKGEDVRRMSPPALVSSSYFEKYFAFLDIVASTEDKLDEEFIRFFSKVEL